MVKSPTSMPIHKDPNESLNDIYKWLMAPIAFFVLGAWTYLNYVAQTILSNPNLRDLYPSQVTQADLIEGPLLLSFEVLVYVPTLILYLVTYYLRPGKAWLVSRIISYTGAFFVLLYVGFTFADEYFNLNLENHVYWASGLLISVLLATALVESCYRRYKRDYAQ